MCQLLRNLMQSFGDHSASRMNLQGILSIRFENSQINAISGLYFIAVTSALQPRMMREDGE
jgi:hypothetical protein